MRCSRISRDAVLLGLGIWREKLWQKFQIPRKFFSEKQEKVYCAFSPIWFVFAINAACAPFARSKCEHFCDFVKSRRPCFSVREKKARDFIFFRRDTRRDNR